MLIKQCIYTIPNIKIIIYFLYIMESPLCNNNDNNNSKTCCYYEIYYNCIFYLTLDVNSLQLFTCLLRQFWHIICWLIIKQIIKINEFLYLKSSVMLALRIMSIQYYPTAYRVAQKLITLLPSCTVRTWPSDIPHWFRRLYPEWCCFIILSLRASMISAVFMLVLFCWP